MNHTETETETRISKYFEEDHDRLDDLFKNFQQLKRTDFPLAKECFVSFKFGLQRHIVWEEGILFPLFEEKTGMRGVGPTFVMRQEHKQIGAFLEAIHQKVKEGNPDSDSDEHDLINVLIMHNQKEEMILYPSIDRVASAEDVKEVFEAMKKTPEASYNNCCHTT